nr:hypothetical protein [Tanacetum cinerariifolium]
MFDKAFRMVNTFEDFRIEFVEGKEKRAGQELIQERTKKQKVEDGKETADLKQLMEIIPDQEEIAIDAIPLAVNCGSTFLMNTMRNDRRKGDSNDHQKGWLKLSIGQYNGGVFPQTRLTKTMKVYTCSFCERKFHNPQALGGHQNGHRLERQAVKRSHGENDNEAGEGDHSHVQPSDGEKLEEMEWCESSYSYLTPASQQPDSNTLDLNLKL